MAVRWGELATFEACRDLRRQGLRPNPEYPAGHGCVSTAFAESVRHFFGTRHVKVTLTSSIAGSIPHVFNDTNGMIEEIKMARVFGGMHFPTSVEHGTILGKNVARLVAREHFEPVSRK